MNAILIAGAALVGLPVLLHLIMKQEPKRLSFPAFRFLTQKLKTNQRKLRLRHFLLLALRMLLIALFCLTLYQPTLKSDRLNIRGEQPIATVIVIDTSPSMGYTQNDQTRLQDAVRRARELLDELPEKSPVAVLTTDDPTGYWRDVAEARAVLDRLDRPRGGTQPVSSALGQAYQLLAHIDAQDVEDTAQLPKLLAVFTDRTAASWEAAQTETLKKLRDAVPDPKPTHAVVDVGVDQPLNVAILNAEMKPQVVAANQPAVVTVTVGATGPADLPPVDAVVVGALDGTPTPERRQARVEYGRTQTVQFRFENLKPGTHRVAFTLETPDRLAEDNSRFLTFKVGEARRVLVVADEPRAAAFWQLAVNSKDDFVCVVARPEDVTAGKDGLATVRFTADPTAADPQSLPPEPLRAFDVVCLLGVENPALKTDGGSLWDKLRPYVRGGGKLVVIPGERVSAEGYKAAADLMPGEIGKVIETDKLTPPPPKQTAPGWPGGRDGANGVTWVLDQAAVQHPMLRPFQEWQAQERRDVVYDPRVAWKYWEVKKDPAPEAAVVVSYNDAEKPADRRPAVLERGIPDPAQPTKLRGRVLLLTTPMDTKPTDQAWNDYWVTDNTWVVVFPTLVVNYLAGDSADANFNYQTGQTVPVPLPKGGLPPGAKVTIEGPHLTTEEAIVEVGEKQTELRVGPPRTNLPGAFKLTLSS
ncbi:MAG TPA: BatA domain-containing protein, partial [Gemmata sp.]|nr:BatA domain-containing protein [Gemmata sp.]